MAEYKEGNITNLTENQTNGKIKQVRSITQYDLFRGVTDFGNLGQFDYYESGYSFLFVISGPRFLNEYALKTNRNGDDTFYKIYHNYMHMLEFEFRGLSGLENMTADGTMEINNGFDTINVINKVKMQSGSSVTMNYTERSGGLINKFHSKFLSGIKDPRTGVKHYHGLIADGTYPTPGFELETFTFLYVVTDNTTRNVEKAFLLLGAQPTTADYSMYESEKGSIEKKEISIEFNCFPITGETIDKKAQYMINAIHNPEEYGFSGDKAERVKYIVDSEDYGKYTVKTTGNGNGLVRTSLDDFADDDEYKYFIASKASTSATESGKTK